MRINKVYEWYQKMIFIRFVEREGIALTEWTHYTKNEQDLTDSLPNNCKIEFDKKGKKFRLIKKYK